MNLLLYVLLPVKQIDTEKAR
jgi:hypothetical protein